MFTYNQIGVVHSCFKEKFGIPRQPGLVTEAKGTLELLPPYNRAEAVRGLEAFSHIWVTFVFHACLTDEWKPTVRPPRLGGNKRIGVFATRSTHRPNPIGLSVVKLDQISFDQGKVILHLSGIDLLDGTPILDIKPYLPYADTVLDATGGFAPDAPQLMFNVRFSEQAKCLCQQVKTPEIDLAVLITQLLSHDPRPAYYGEEATHKQFGMRLLAFDVKWEIQGASVCVLEIVKISD